MTDLGSQTKLATLEGIDEAKDSFYQWYSVGHLRARGGHFEREEDVTFFLFWLYRACGAHGGEVSDL